MEPRGPPPPAARADLQTWAPGQPSPASSVLARAPERYPPPTLCVESLSVRQEEGQQKKKGSYFTSF